MQKSGTVAIDNALWISGRAGSIAELMLRLIYPMCTFLLQRRGFIKSSFWENPHKA